MFHVTDVLQKFECVEPPVVYACRYCFILNTHAADTRAQSSMLHEFMFSAENYKKEDLVYLGDHALNAPLQQHYLYVCYGLLFNS